ncbi:MAG: hypothetical protein KKB81_06235 [Candidatus Margulisbacteria bacterium]|nr:hypothetical protein [Candidatus Margulisiibacteriota bacterium]MBU1021454.1 hypothetical protein [Candidatus Margulisiibacteriota bacterium]MBU1728375.1 hypothetical protein [Candidatus Margulisiibacteriota bacterium]MBU1955882.1 hypothetical protein [Candidatus Margulisiibacteriota bacterium]
MINFNNFVTRLKGAKKVIALLFAGLLLIAFSVSAHATLTIPAQAAVSADGNKLIVPSQATGDYKIVIYDVSNPALPSTLATINTAGAVYGVAVNPAGTKAYISISGSGVGVINLATNTQTNTISLPTNFLRNIAFSPDGAYAFVVDVLGKVYIINTATETLADTITISGGVGAYGVAVKPDGTRLAVSRRTASGAIYIYDITDIANPTYIKSMNGLVYPTYLFYGEGTQLGGDPTHVWLYVKNREELATEEDVKIYDSADDTYTLSGTIKLADEHGFDRNFTNDPISGYTGLALSANRQMAYVAVYNNTASKSQVYRFSSAIGNGILATTTNIVKENCSYPVDSIAGVPDGRTIWFGYSLGSHYNGHDDVYYGNNNSGFTQNAPTAPEITAPQVGATDVTEMTWNAGSDQETPGANLTYDVDYILAADINTNNWVDYNPGVSGTSVSLENLDALTSYYLRIRTSDGTDNSAFVYVGPFTTGDTGSGSGECLVIDNFEGVNVQDPAGYIAYNLNYTLFGTMVDPDDATNRIMQVDGYAAGADGWWSGVLDTPVRPMDISAYDAIAFELKGNGSSDIVKIRLLDEDGDIFELPGGVVLSTATWQTVVILMEGMEDAPVYQAGDGVFSGNILAYGVKYGSSDASGGPHYFDDVRAISSTAEAIPGPTVDITVLMQGFYDEGAGTLAEAYIDLELRDTDMLTVLQTFSNIPLDDQGNTVYKLNYLVGEGQNDDFYLVVRHSIPLAAYYSSNHSPVMIANSINLEDGVTKTINLTNGSETMYGTDALVHSNITGLDYMRAGNINGDQFVDISDFMLWALANGTEPGNPNWLVDANLNGDGFVDINDFMYWAGNNGTEVQLPEY